VGDAITKRRRRENGQDSRGEDNAASSRLLKTHGGGFVPLLGAGKSQGQRGGWADWAVEEREQINARSRLPFRLSSPTRALLLRDVRSPGILEGRLGNSRDKGSCQKKQPMLDDQETIAD